MFFNKDWTLAALSDALEALGTLVDDYENGRITDEDAVGEELANVYAKLNFAKNTASIGPGAIDTVDHDALIAYPREDLFEIFFKN